MNWSVKTAKEIVGKWGYEEKEWWQPIAEALIQSRQDLLKELRGECEELKDKDCDGESCECEIGYEEASTYECHHCDDYSKAVDDVIKLLESKE